MKTGEKFKSANKAGKVAYLDSASGLFNAMIYGNSQRFYGRSGKLIYKDNPVVNEAWDLASKTATSGLTAKLRQFQPGWDLGLVNSTFATTVCPAVEVEAALTSCRSPSARGGRGPGHARSPCCSLRLADAALALLGCRVVREPGCRLPEVSLRHSRPAGGSGNGGSRVMEDRWRPG